MSVVLANNSQMEKIEEVLATGNLASLKAAERVQYLNKLCEVTGLNPLTKPFEFIAMQGRVVAYATKGCADQLRKIHGVSITVKEQKVENGLIIVTVEAQDKTGRIDSDMGVIPMMGLKGESLSNALMKCLTKAKRRVTLSIVGLGILDESEIESINTTNAEIVEETKVDEMKSLLKKIDRSEEQFKDYLSTLVKREITDFSELSDDEAGIALVTLRDISEKS